MQSAFSKIILRYLCSLGVKHRMHLFTRWIKSSNSFLVPLAFIVSTRLLADPVTNALPAVLPGKGLAQHDFFYAGEGKAEKMSIVHDGKVVWSYAHPGRGEISDAVLEPGGKILFAHQFGVTEITLDGKVSWNLDAPDKTEIHTAQPFGPDSVWYIQNGDPARFIVVDKNTGAFEHQFELPVKNPKSTHGQFRHARMTAAGTIMVAHMDLGKAVEYAMDGKALWSADVPGIWSATPLANGNILAASNKKFVREINRDGQTVWEWTVADSPEYAVNNPQLAARLPNGNTLINNWFNQWAGKLDLANAPVQAIEVTPDKKIVWALRSWEAPADLGPSTTIQILDGSQLPVIPPGHSEMNFKFSPRLSRILRIRSQSDFFLISAIRVIRGQFIPAFSVLAVASAVCAFAAQGEIAPDGDFPVTIKVDAAKPIGELTPAWRFFGADEPNYAYMKATGKNCCPNWANLAKPQRSIFARIIC